MPASPWFPSESAHVLCMQPANIPVVDHSQRSPSTPTTSQPHSHPPHLPPLHLQNWPKIPEPGPKNKINHAPQKHSNKNNTRPIEPRGIDGVLLRPKTPEEGPAGVADGQRVDGDSPAAEGELGVREGFGLGDAAVEEAADAEGVALEEGDCGEGGYCVECYRTWQGGLVFVSWLGFWLGGKGGWGTYSRCRSTP